MKHTQKIEQQRIQKIINIFSLHTAEHTKNAFLEHLRNNGLDKNIELLDSPIYTKDGLATYFRTKIDGKVVPVLQFGSLMINSAVKSVESDFAVHHGGWQNGPILGNGCSLFQVRVLDAIKNRHPNQTVEDVLLERLDEDKKEHGRMLEIVQLLDNDLLKDKSLNGKIGALPEEKKYYDNFSEALKTIPSALSGKSLNGVEWDDKFKSSTKSLVDSLTAAGHQKHTLSSLSKIQVRSK